MRKLGEMIRPTEKKEGQRRMKRTERKTHQE